MDSNARPWATPEEQTELRAAPADLAIASAAQAVEPEVARLPPQPFRMQPLTIPEILDGAFGILRASPAKVIGIVAAISAPVDLFLAFLNRDALANGGVFEDFGILLDASASSDGNIFGSNLALDYILPQLALVFAAAALAKLIMDWFQGDDPTVGEVLSFVARRWWKVLCVYALVHIAEVIGFVLLVIPGFFVMVMFMLSIPALITEDLSVIGALKRSRALTKGVGSRVFAVAFASAFVVIGIELALGVLPLLLGSWIGETYGWLVVALGSLFTSILSLVGTAGITLILYYDTRVRREGLDLALEAQAVFGPTLSGTEFE